MESFWDLIKSHTSASHAHTAFLAAWTAMWTLGALIVGLLFCGVTVHTSLAENIATVVVIAAYTGIIFGLFGGMFFLMRTQD